MNVNFEYYKIFYYVAKYGSFTKAARALGSTQPNVTRAMNCLEQQLHNTLFIRTNRGYSSLRKASSSTPTFLLPWLNYLSLRRSYLTVLL